MEVNFEQIESIFHKALSCDNERRPEYVREACSGDAGLEREILSLVTAYESDPGFLGESVLSLGLRAVANKELDKLVGQQIGQYLVEKRLGSGGMGDVFLAEDTKLDRKVALKFLSSELQDDKWARNQLFREAKAVARLEHPNICGVHGIESIGEHEFIVMQYIEGETLSEYLKRPNREGTDPTPIIRQVVEAIAHAHAHGVMHRDIKPGNIMITPEGLVKVLDFGLAKLARRDKDPQNKPNTLFSQKGLVLGTIAYMSPEQLRAEELDYRSDIFSLGVLIAEIINGVHPFLGKSDADTIAAILNSEPLGFTNKFNQRPENLQKVAKKCLQKVQVDRYESAEALLYEIESVKKEAFGRWLSGKAAVFLSGIAILLIGLYVGWSLFLVPSIPNKIIVLPFEIMNVSDDKAYVANQVAEEIAESMKRDSSVRIDFVSGNSVLVKKFKDPYELGKELDAEFVIIGSVKEENNILKVTSELLNTSKQVSVWKREYSIPESKVFDSEREIAFAILNAIGVSSGEESGANGSKTNSNARKAAYGFYLRGKYLFRFRDEKNIKMAIDQFQKATETDPTFADAYALLSNAYANMGSITLADDEIKAANRKAKAAAMDAIEAGPNESQSHMALAIVFHRIEWDWSRAEESYLKAIELDKNNASARYSYSVLLSMLHKDKEAIDQASIARDLDPFSPSSDVSLARAYYFAGDYENSLKVLTNNRFSDRNSLQFRYMLGLVYIQMGDLAKAKLEFEAVYKERRILGGPALGFVLAKQGNRSGANDLLRELGELRKTQFVPAQESAFIYMGLGDREKALDMLEKSYDERYAPVISVNVEPVFASLRTDGRFKSLMKKLSLETTR